MLEEKYIILPDIALKRLRRRRLYKEITISVLQVKEYILWNWPENYSKTYTYAHILQRCTILKFA